MVSARFGPADCCGDPATPENGVPTFPKAALAFLASVAAASDEGASTYVAYCIPKTFQPDIKSSLSRKTAEIDVVDLSRESFMTTKGVMSGLPYVSVTDVAGNQIGGGAALCAIADTQDESLVQFYFDVLFFSLFVSDPMPARVKDPQAPSPPRAPLAPPMLPAAPVSAVFGARRYLNYLSGHHAPSGSCGSVSLTPFWNIDLEDLASAVSVPLTASGARAAVRMYPQAFVAVTSQGGIPVCKGGFMLLCSSNLSSSQRLPQMLIDNVQVLYAAYEPTNYNLFTEALPLLIKKIGVSKFGSGVWLGDSNLFFLADWLAVSLCSGYTPPTLNYFFYRPYWCENGPNDCFLLAGSSCRSCIPSNQTASYLPSAYGSADYVQVIQKFKGTPPQQFLQEILKVLPLPATKQIFEHLLDSV